MKALFPGSFDPITYGHLDIIQRCTRLFDEVVVGIGHNITKKYLLSLEQRLKLLLEVTKDLPQVEILPISGVLVDFCVAENIDVVVKGLRFAADFDYELQQAHLNALLSGNRKLETLLLPAGKEWGTISSTMVREIASLGGSVTDFVPPVVAEELRLGLKA